MGIYGKPLFAYRLLITTAPDLSFNAQDITEASFIPVGIVVRNKLEGRPGQLACLLLGHVRHSAARAQVAVPLPGEGDQ